jgi:hypothetical protein
MVRPYLFATNQDLLDLTDTLGAHILEQHDFGNHCFHTELGIGDSIIVVESADTPLPDAPRATTLIYVPDTQAVTNTLAEKGWYSRDALRRDAGDTRRPSRKHLVHRNLSYTAFLARHNPPFAAGFWYSGKQR